MSNPIRIPPPSGPLTATAPAFTPVATKVGDRVLDASFITHTIPDISPDAGVIGICTVPHERAGTDDLGWHIADFLAFKVLLQGETHAKAQTWLAQCDIADIVGSNPQEYTHGKIGRLVGVAATASSYSDRGGTLRHREDQINVEPSASKLMDEFRKALLNRAKVAKHLGLPLIVIICGPTTLEQDVFFGETDAEHCVTSAQMRQDLGDGVNAIVITPALFSAGWQVNPFFCRLPPRNLRADRTEFLARQFGAIFAKEHVAKFIGWACPLLDSYQLKGQEKESAFPGPAKPSYHQQDAIEDLEVKIQNALAGRLSIGHGDHSFNFEEMNDDWEKMVGPRQNKPLSYYKQKWQELQVGPASAMEEQTLSFLGKAFGGNKQSQTNHLKHLVKESFTAWAGYWALPFGRSARAAFKSFIDNPSPEYRDCHEIFNITEHRATSAVLADMIVKYFYLPKPYQQRCRDWDEQRWNGESSDATHLAANRQYGEVTKIIPGVNIPPGVNPNHLSVIQTRLEVPASYLSVSLCSHHLARTDGLYEVVNRISGFFEEVKVRQVKLLLNDVELHEKCTVWLQSIKMPIRRLDAAVISVKPTRASARAPAATNQSPVETTGHGNTEHGNAASDVLIAVASIGVPTGIIQPTPPQANTEPVDSSDALPDEIKKMLPNVDFKAAIRVLLQEKDDLIKELLETSEAERLAEIREKMIENQQLLSFMEAEARKKEAQLRGSVNESESGASRAQPAQNAAQWLPPHLRRQIEPPAQGSPDNSLFDLTDPWSHGARNSSPGQHSAEFTPRIAQRAGRDEGQANTYVPPHLRSPRRTSTESQN